MNMITISLCMIVKNEESNLAGFDKDGKVTGYVNRNRLFKRSKGYRWIEPIHENIPSQGNLLMPDITWRSKRVSTTCERAGSSQQ